MKKMHMTKKISLICLFTWVAAVTAVGAASEPVSGEIVGGFRVLPIQKGPDSLQFSVYRGDYIKFDVDDTMAGTVLSIPDLSIVEQLTDNIEDSPYVKMKHTGAYAFSLGDLTGIITVIEYKQPNYRELTAREAAELIDNIQPLILDVRTPFEYKRGHLQNSVLIPVQELQSRWKEIPEYKNQDVLIYCATGNRSTVASKILIDSGFKRIMNLRYGIVDWGKRRFPVVQK